MIPRAPRYPRRAVLAVNPNDRDWTRHRYVFWFDAHAPGYLLVWANDEGSALAEAADYLAEHAPGMFCDQEVDERLAEARARGLDDDAAYERAEAGTLRVGNYGRPIRSEDVGIALVNPSRDKLVAFGQGAPW